jgi:argininosuccinate lyase
VNGPDEDVHSFVERQLVERASATPAAACTPGRSRNEQVSVDLRLYLRAAFRAAAEGLRALVAAFADQAERRRRRADAVLYAHAPGHAGPRRALLPEPRRALGAITIAWPPPRRSRRLPLGSGAIAGTGYAVDTAPWRTALASRVVANSMDASSDRDFVASLLYASALAMVHLSRIAEDFILFTSEEFGFFELADARHRQQHDAAEEEPDPLELVRGKAGRAVGHLTGLLVTMKGLPTGYNKDLQEDKEAVFDAEDTLAVSLAPRPPSCRGCRCARSVTAPPRRAVLLATDVADYLVGRGMPFRRAHEVVGAMVRHLLAEGRHFESLSLDEWRAFINC